MEAQDNNPNTGAEILIVEDSPTQAERLKYVLEKHRYRLSAARNGREALASIAKHPPTLVISDIVMPEMDGYQLCGHIKKDEKLKNIPVILLTSLTDPVDVMKGLECGADNFIFKPYDEQYLLARIAYMLANQHLRESDSTQMGVEVFFSGRKFFITSDRLQILNLLLSTYEAAVQRNQELATARDELRHLNEHLEARVRERTAALEAEILERRRAEEEVRRLNTGLEQRVLERTAELEAANKELEAFSYSVSHDLRAPLRAVDGFSQAVLEDYGSQLPEEGRRYLQTIRDGTQHMGALIDDLLTFSRLSRLPLVKQTVDTAGLVNKSLNELSAQREGREIDLRIGNLPPCEGDPALLKQVWVNLLSNALKYTRKQQAARIEIGSRREQDEDIFFVRDNGTGFDMQYAHKLFGVFQRLHHADEFEGTGVGLAIVQRVVHRHGGRIWAEAAIDRGAEFNFTLGEGANYG